MTTQIFVKDLTGGSYPIEIPETPDRTVLGKTVYNKVMELRGLRRDRFRLVHNGNDLREDIRYKYYELRPTVILNSRRLVSKTVNIENRFGADLQIPITVKGRWVDLAQLIEDEIGVKIDGIIEANGTLHPRNSTEVISEEAFASPDFRLAISLDGSGLVKMENELLGEIDILEARTRAARIKLGFVRNNIEMFRSGKIEGVSFPSRSRSPSRAASSVRPASPARSPTRPASPARSPTRSVVVTSVGRGDSPTRRVVVDDSDSEDEAPVVRRMIPIKATRTPIRRRVVVDDSDSDEEEVPPAPRKPTASVSRRPTASRATRSLLN